MHFITASKFGNFDVALSNLNKLFLFGLPEGYWPNGKTANNFLYMFHVVLYYHSVCVHKTFEILACEIAHYLTNEIYYSLFAAFGLVKQWLKTQYV